ncbi:MAG: glycerophosphodiester phosphodiesterase [bacterium]|nr:glycerophosphodiester phosphodiesterase [bacterium]
MNKDLAWMLQPFAHRGLHDVSKGIVENTRSSVQAALNHQFGFEVDLRAASCGTIMVFHDEHLDRLTLTTGRVSDMNLAQLQQIQFKDTSDEMMSLQNLLDLNDGRVPMLLEIKSNWRFDDTTSLNRFVSMIIRTLDRYKGDYAVMSFDPLLISAFHDLAPAIPRGLVSERFEDLKHWHPLSWWERLRLRFLLSFPRSRPDFIAYDINALPAIAPIIARSLFKRPLLTWTVRTSEQLLRAQKYSDSMIFEGFVPPDKRMTSPS